MLVACRNCHRQYDVGGMRPDEKVRCRCGTAVQVPRKKVHHARMVHCSNCGATLRTKTTSCEYCGGKITAAERNLGPPCPECYARLRKGAQFCSECGVSIRPEAMKAIRLDAKCPRCKGDLILQELPEGHYTECSLCAGIWLDGDSFHQVIEKKEESSLGKLFSAKKSQPVQAYDQPVRYLPCPTCGQMMNRKNFGGCSGVVIDWCKGHGYWFDTHELEKVISFVKSGGMARARELEIQNQKAELERLKKQEVWAGQHIYRDLGSGDRDPICDIDLISSLQDIWSRLGGLFGK